MTLEHDAAISHESNLYGRADAAATTTSNRTDKRSFQAGSCKDAERGLAVWLTRTTNLMNLYRALGGDSSAVDEQ